MPRSDPRTAPETAPHFDAIVIGAGINGLYQIYRLLERDLTVRGLETGSDVGGTWHWNRYPGARLDSESYSYGYFFSQELLDEWTWSEEFVSQPELEQYFQYVADKFGLREHIDFNAQVTSAVFDENENIWRIRTAASRSYTAQFLVATTGILSTPIFPDIPNEDEFLGEVYHTGLWPAESPDLEGKRVAVFGTGSSGVQIIQELGPIVSQLTVFQRTANWATPLNNRTISDERAREIRKSIEDIHDAAMSSAACFIYDGRPQSTWDVSDEERRAYYEELWNAPGMSYFARGFNDVLTDRAANDTLVAFLTEKIQQRVRDPEVARKLTPAHGFGEKRPPLESGYYEIFNQDNVELIALGEEPIVRYTRSGFETSKRKIDADVVILATGFDALTGSFLRIDIEGRGGRKLADWWDNGPRTYLGAAVHHFPNMFVLGPQGVAGNFPRCAEGWVDWVTGCIADVKSLGYQCIEATESAEAEFVNSINETVQGTLLRDAKSWIWGSNVKGKVRGNFPAYLPPQPLLRQKWAEVASNGYQGFELTRGKEPQDAEPRQPPMDRQFREQETLS